MTEDAGLRDRLALERTRLANERTFLAYVRTALSLLAGGAVMLQFFPEYRGAVVIGWTLLGLGIVVLGIGSYRFLKVRRSLED
jgi:putative membrane protein